MGAGALTRIGRAGLVCAAACLAACGSPATDAPPPRAPSGVAAGAGAAAASTEPVLDLAPGPALDLTPAEGEIVVRTDVLRGHPVGARMGPLLASWPGWRATLHAIARDPVADLDWFDLVGPSAAGGAAQGRMLARMSGPTSLAALDGRLVALQARSAEPATGHVEAGVVAAAARLDGALRVVFRVPGSMVAATPASRGPVLSHVLVRSRLHDPATAPLEAVRADVPRPHELVRAVPPTVARIQVHVLALANGDADGSADAACLTAEDASRAAAAMRDSVAQQNNAIVRLMTHGLLDGLAIRAEGASVKLHLHATRDQLDAVVGLATAMIPPGDDNR